MNEVMARLGNDPKDTKGRKALVKLLDSVSQGIVSRAIEVSQVSVSKWAKGTMRPTELSRRRLERLYGIPAGDWLTAAEFSALSEAS